ncbi:hypothetical protein HUS84_28225 [Pseudomonas chlororaphis]|uniref:hypothetical protein n=1 Tax=Pseudomonas chlororaphis TaxID=587753 RepID=UPI001B336D57|nr:hypothetical protein [Pseudomonas chlororaphis]MBP5077782.1 hypothetical protein [Pseudomonas chlororaphis]
MRIVALVSALMGASIAQAGQITWTLENNFPVFRNADQLQAIKEAWGEGQTASQFLARQNAESLRKLLPRTHETLWLPDKGNYDEKLFNKEHSIIVQYTGAPPLASCTWFYNGDKKGIPLSCNQPYLIPGVKEDEKFELRVDATDDPGYTLADQVIGSTMILGFGDSFASGEGNPDRAAIGNSEPTLELKKGYDLLAGNKASKHFVAGADWWDTTCHRSLLAWQSMYALHRAVSNPREVVRFATFTCSGAEIYDGFFRAQLNPPATDISSRVKNYRDRDGGNYLKGTSWPRDEKRNTFPALNLSQLNAAIDLLCPGRTVHAKSFRRSREVRMLGNRRYYGDVKYDECRGDLRKVDQVLMSFGGNDFGFAGVVKWGFIPRVVYKNQEIDSSNPMLETISRDEAVQGWNALQLFRAVAQVIEPEDARKVAGDHLSKVYGDVQFALENYLKVEPGKVRVLLYPNPIQRPLQSQCAARTDAGNVAMAEYVVRLAPWIPFFSQKQAAGLNYVLTDQHAQEIEGTFITNLVAYQRTSMAAQRSAAANVSWTAIESQPAFAGRSLCGVSQECLSGNCSQDDLYAWTQPKEPFHDSLRAITSFSKWEPYSSERTRALRTSNDALMTQARFVDGRIVEDWMAGSMHPDARAHAVIADQISLK